MFPNVYVAKMSQIQAVEYAGQKVLTNNQLAEIFNCNTSTIRAAFARSQNDFFAGIDFFFLEKDALRNFKAANYCNAPTANFCNAPFSPLASSLYLWTLSGVEKISKSIGTDAAKLIYTSLKFGYFQNAAEKSAPTNNSETTPLKFEKAKLLIKAAEIATDKNLRDDLIRMALNLLK